jgi:hypothetical protein
MVETIEHHLMVLRVKSHTYLEKIVDSRACFAGSYVGEYRYSKRIVNVGQHFWGDHVLVVMGPPGINHITHTHRCTRT